MLRRFANPRFVVAAAGLMVAGCAATPRADTEIAVRESLAAELLRIAAEYSTYHRVMTAYNVAPEDCRAPMPHGPRMSASDDESTHGRKLYLLFARDSGYGRLGEAGIGSRSPIGQAIVKEAWKPDAPGSLVPGEKAELFVMFKVDEATAGTDRGWVYGVTTPDGREVIDVGVIASCAACHREAPHEGLFGARGVTR